jgi:TRAP-type C4-dicarboxylate transport system substrate-binding protein
VERLNNVYKNAKEELQVMKKMMSVIACSAMLVAFAGVAFAADISVNLAQYQTGEEFPCYRIAEYFKKRVAELTDGRIEIKHFPGDLLGDWETQQIHVKEGSLDMCFSPSSTSFDPETEFIWLPYFVHSWEGAKNLYQKGGEGEKLLSDICRRNNTHCVGVSPQGFSVVVSNKKFTPMPGDETLKKVKTRVMPAKLEQITGESFGFMTLSMPWGEIHSALMLGTIDAAMGADFSEVVLFKDVVKYQYNYNYAFSAAPWIINLDLWNSLSTEDQEIFEKALSEAIDLEWERAVEAQEDSIAIMEEAGVEVIELTDEQVAANMKVTREKAWSWAAENMYSKEFMEKVRKMAEPLPTEQ